MNADTTALVMAFAGPRQQGLPWWLGVRTLGRAWRDGCAGAIRTGVIDGVGDPGATVDRHRLARLVSNGRFADLDAAVTWACLDAGVLHALTALRFAAQTGSPAVLDALAGAARCGAEVCDEGTVAIGIAAHNGHVEVLARLMAEPFTVKAHHQAGVVRAFGCAATGGQTPVLDWLATRYERCFATGNAAYRCVAARALWCAAAAGSVEVLDRFAAPPFSMGATEARARGGTALLVAARHGHVAVLDRLAQPPYGMGHADVVSPGTAFLEAAATGRVAVLDRFASAPYSMGEADARHLVVLALVGAAEKGLVVVFDKLRQAPYSEWVSPEDTDAALLVACANGHASIVEMLALMWPSRFHDPDNTRVSMLAACSNGLVAVLDRLAQPPYRLGQADASAGNAAALTRAVEAGHVAVVDRLAHPPYSLGHDAASKSDVLRKAIIRGHVAVVERLAKEPYLLGARAVPEWALKDLLVYARSFAGMVELLTRPPFNFPRAE